MSSVRSFLFGVWLYSSILLFGIGLLICRLFGRQMVVAGTGLWGHFVLFGLRIICGARVTVRGLENIPEGGYIIASKHQSMLDTIAPWTFLKDPAFVLKKELLELPVYGWVLRVMRHIPIDRAGGPTALKRMMDAAREAVKDSRAVVIFPEGTRQLVGAAPDYKVGVAGIYRDLGVPCVPMALNTGTVWPAKGLPGRSGEIVFDILPPLPPGMPRAAFMRELQAAIETASDQLVKTSTPSGADSSNNASNESGSL